jgi:hypothetical protein
MIQVLVIPATEFIGRSQIPEPLIDSGALLGESARP